MVTSLPIQAGASSVKVVSAPPGFVSEHTDKVGGGHTGALNYEAATSADCDAGLPPRAEWLASQQRYFDDNPKYPNSYLLICVTTLKTSTDANNNFTKIVALAKTKSQFNPNPKVFPIGGIRGAVGDYVGGEPGIVQLYFTDGANFIFVVCTSLTTGPSPAKTLAIALAQSEDRLLNS
jgi:hypothetical protein